MRGWKGTMRLKGRRARTSRSLTRYLEIKDWSVVDKQRAKYAGEVGRLGALVPESYLDDVDDRFGLKLKILCRVGCLPVLATVTSELGLSMEHARCMLCETDETEDVNHLLLRCPAHQAQRAKMMSTATAAVARGGAHASMRGLDEEMQVRVLLGASTGDKRVDAAIDRAVKRFLRKAWRRRRKVSEAINEEFGRIDPVWSKRALKWAAPVPRPTTATKRAKPGVIKVGGVDWPAGRVMRRQACYKPRDERAHRRRLF
jgi:hypothetical protein